MNRRLILPLVVFLAGALVLAAAAIITFAPGRQGQSGTGTASVGGPFSLTTQEGRTLTDKDLRGAPFLVFFGFTHCPDICPTKLFEISEVLRAAGPKGEKLRALFVTVDPERDTVEAMREYVANFDPRIVALTGTPEQVAQAAKAYRVYYKKVPQGDDYTMDHTGILYLMDPQGRFITHFTPNTPPAEMTARIRKLLG